MDVLRTVFIANYHRVRNEKNKRVTKRGQGRKGRDSKAERGRGGDSNGCSLSENDPK